MARGFDLGQAAAELKLDEATVAAIERDDFGDLPAPIYLKGYLGSYARLLGISEEEVLEEYRAFIQEEASTPLNIRAPLNRQARSSDALVRWFSFALAALIVLVIAWWVFDAMRQDQRRQGTGMSDLSSDSGDESWERPQSAPEISASTREDAMSAGQSGEGSPASQVMANAETTQGSEIADGDRPGSRQSASVASLSAASTERQNQAGEAAGPANEAVLQDGSEDESGRASGSSAAASLQQQSDSSANSAPNTADPTARSAAESLASAAAADNRLRLTFAEDCWIDVRDADGTRLARGIEKAQTSRDLEGQGPFRIVLGNSTGVSIELNGEPVSPSVFRRVDGRPARFTLNGDVQ